MTALPPGPWRWLADGSALIVDKGQRPVVLMARRGRGSSDPSAYLGTRDEASGILVPLAPEHPVARAIAAVPELVAVVLQARGVAADVPGARGAALREAIDTVLDKVTS